MNVHVAIVAGPLAHAPPEPTFEGAGAVLRFDGIVRPQEAGSAIDALTYAVYEPMATRVLGALARRVVEQYALRGLIAEHSRGRVPRGACAFRLWVAATHRREGLLAMADFIEQLKRDVPIWKSPAVRADGAPPEPRAAELTTCGDAVAEEQA